jgi:hypothetical protein
MKHQTYTFSVWIRHLVIKSQRAGSEPEPGFGDLFLNKLENVF